VDEVEVKALLREEVVTRVDQIGQHPLADELVKIIADQMGDKLTRTGPTDPPPAPLPKRITRTKPLQISEARLMISGALMPNRIPMPIMPLCIKHLQALLGIPVI